MYVVKQDVQIVDFGIASLYHKYIHFVDVKASLLGTYFIFPFKIKCNVCYESESLYMQNDNVIFDDKFLE